jgi:type IV pilus assembly protein PilY1
MQPYYSCVQEARTSTPYAVGAYSFNDEYKIATKLPYDSGFYIDFHRPVTGTTLATSCVYAPYALPGANTPNGVGPLGLGLGGNAPGAAPNWPGTGTYAGDFPSTAIAQRLFTTPATACTFGQLNDGALDSALTTMRFGLMTFDVDPANGTGATNVTNALVANTPTSPFDGMWSYFPGWNGTGAFTPAQGRPGGCNTLSMFEVGARNPAAPPWEGRFVQLPASNADSTTVATNNANIQTAINSMRPYGATPIAGMLSDAQYYYWNDPAGPRGTNSDPFVAGGCRSEYIILLTDGAPNMDMRTPCEGSGGQCPFAQRPWEITAALANAPTGQKVKTYVIGFAVSSVVDQGNLVQCSSLIQNNTLSATCLQNPVPSNYAACCNLQQIALNGGTNHAYFADTPGALNQALSDIFGQISTQTSTRTTPTYSPVVSNPSSGAAPTASTFLSSFNPGVGKPWSGDIQRQQQICTLSNGTFSVPPAVVTLANGDDFATNIDSHAGSMPRRFYAVQPGTQGQAVDATAIIRPYVPNSPLDNLGIYGGTQYGSAIATLLANITPAALGITSNPSNLPQCANLSNTAHLSATDCEALGFNFLFGQQSTPSLQTNPPPPSPSLPPDGQGYLPFNSRYCQSGCTTGSQDRSALGDIFHATPTVVAAPNALINDESYQQFATQNANNNVYGTSKLRRTILYAPTNDGLLHAFWTDVTQQENNELWAFVPPAVMPSIIPEYPSAHQLLLDGAVVVKDVVFGRTAVRSATDLATATSSWHTMLVGSYGTQGRGFYAIDVSNPDPNASPPGAPQFRWQLTNMGTTSGVANKNIFGVHSATPAITTVYADLSGAGSTTNAKEYGVAVLPGGSETGPTGGPCARAATATGPNTSTPITGFTGRTAVRCWGANALAADPVIGRSVAIVRMETGEIIKVFMRLADLPATHPLVASGRVIDTPLDSPMTGIISAYPTDTGAVAQKLFMADADGTVWKFDLTDVNPSNWRGEMFIDTYNLTVDTDAVNNWSHGQPIAVPMVTSLDRLGSVVLNFATGDQETYTTTGTNFIYSVSEKVQGSSAFKLRAQVNWYMPRINGERVSGPMSVFDGVHYLATFKPTVNGGCSVGSPFIWGMDYVNPNDPNDLSKGGLPRLVNGGTNFQFIDPTGGNNQSPLAGHIIPGISIQAQPACASSASGSDSYAFGATHSSTSNVTAGGYSLFAQVGTKGNSGSQAVGTYSLSLPPPQTATVIDSWAAVIE